VEFASAASASAVCSFCRSTLVRDGEALKRIGQSAELFDDHSPLQLQASGKFQGAPFTLIGRLQYGYDGGTWNEWHALFDGGKSGWLSEDNGRYVMAFDAPAPADAPAAADLSPGQRLAVGGGVWSVASVTSARLIAAQGELPQAPRPAGTPFTVSDLRNERDEVATLDYGDPSGRPLWSLGRSVRLADLALQGLREASEKSLQGQGFACPSCGASLEIKLSSTQSIVCGQCKAVVDVSQGIGPAMNHYAQEQGHTEPLIPLGRVGKLSLGGGAPAVEWQVVGYVERCEVDGDSDEEQVFWREYLLYNRQEGFAFLVDAEDGWSSAVPLTGAAKVSGDSATWKGQRYAKLYDYTGEVTYVLGEFYWRLARGERTVNTDYAAGNQHLNRERAGNEVAWSAGHTLDAEVVADAFGLPKDSHAALQRSSSSGGSSSGLGSIVVIVVVVLLVMLLMAKCSGDSCDPLREAYGAASAEYQQCVASHRSSTGVRTGGGSYGGFSSGGGSHK
jgi:hypothetical protein